MTLHGSSCMETCNIITYVITFKQFETNIAPTVVNPIQINKQINSMERISKHLPTKSSFEIMVEDAKIIDDMNVTYESDSNSEIISDSDNMLDSGADEEIIMSENSEIDLDEELDKDLLKDQLEEEEVNEEDVAGIAYMTK